MILPYWEINPEDLGKENLSIEECSPQVKKNIFTLVQAYKEASEKIKNISKQIMEQNFVEQLELFFDQEAYLAEIYFYLTEGVSVLELEENVLEIVNEDYILSYITQLEDKREKNYRSEPILSIWLNREYPKAYERRFLT